MTDIDTGIEDTALDSMSIVPDDIAGHAHDPRQEAGQDKSIGKRLEKDPTSEEAQLDNALDESMDASDPPANIQPGRDEPAPSSGFDEDAERNR